MGNRFTDINLQYMIASRMGWNMDDPKNPFKYIHAVILKEGTIVVFVVTPDGRHTTIEDEQAIYPSDQLVTQLRLFAGQ